MAYTDEQLRTLANLAQTYQQWLEAARERDALPYGMRWKTSSGREYLYAIHDRGGNGRSLGPRSAHTEALLASYESTRERLGRSWDRLVEQARIARALRLPAIAEPAGHILRQFDRRAMMSRYIMVAGTNALLAYSLEAAGPIIVGGDMATDDVDLLWSRDHETSLLATADAGKAPSILAVLKEVDDTYTLNQERPFQFRNSKAYEVEILVPPSQIPLLPAADRLRPVELEEVEWLLGGQPVDQVVPVKGDSAARLIAPDPRRFALQKLWLSRKPGRLSVKRPKDERQGQAVLDACANGDLPRHPLTESFVASLPEPLLPHWERWRKTRSFQPLPDPFSK